MNRKTVKEPTARSEGAVIIDPDKHNRELVESLKAELSKYQELAETVNGIRNSIVGAQTVNWSEHIYPLVAALEKAGIKGLPYPKAMKNIGTILQRNANLEVKCSDLLEAVGGVIKRLWAAYKNIEAYEKESIKVELENNATRLEEAVSKAKKEVLIDGNMGS
jgi:hypothetical protein